MNGLQGLIIGNAYSRKTESEVKAALAELDGLEQYYTDKWITSTDPAKKNYYSGIAKAYREAGLIVRRCCD